MGKGGKDNCRGDLKRSVRAKDIGSDDSDEDYVVEKNPSDDDSEDLGESVDEYASEESFGSFVLEDEEEDEEEYRKVVVRSNRRKGSRGKTRNGKIRGKISRKRKRVSYEEEEEDDEDFVNDDDVEFTPNDDEELTPNDEEEDDDDDFVDEDEELSVRKRSNKLKGGSKRANPKRGLKRPRTKRRKSRVVKKPIEKKRRLKKKSRVEIEDDEYEGDFIDDCSVSRERSRKKLGPKSRNYAVSSDSEFVLSGSSDDDYTISEEEREQVREEVKANSRSTGTLEDGDLCQQVKPSAKKGKEKVKEVKTEMGKQVCGVCLSEEDKRRLRGSLDCCSHYFCFTCIMEWSKVESRCPLCKQRFKTITKNGRTAAAIGVDSRNVVIEVPKRDQVYQPSEEEIRSFIDPYENVICTECREGGDDGLMLLCDLCDSPAHTYCVGLGQQVPEGNWYCEGCRPVALGSSSSQSREPLPDQRTTSHVFNRPSPIGTNGESTINPVVESSPRVAVNVPSPRFPPGDFQAASPVAGTGAPTLSVRRQLHRHIQNILSSNRILNMARRINIVPDSNLHIDRYSESIQNLEVREMPTQNVLLDERLRANDYPSSSFQNNNPLSFRTGQLRGQSGHFPPIVASERSVNLTLWPELSAMNSVSSHGQFHQYNRPGMASEISLSPHRAREESQFYVVKERLQSLVKSHLKSLSQDIELGNDTLKEIARSSTHTILAACGLEHKRTEVQLVPMPSICSHGDRLIAGQTSIMKGFCSGCFDTFTRDVVKRIMDTRLPPGWLSLGL